MSTLECVICGEKGDLIRPSDQCSHDVNCCGSCLYQWFVEQLLGRGEFPSCPHPACSQFASEGLIKQCLDASERGEAARAAYEKQLERRKDPSYDREKISVNCAGCKKELLSVKVMMSSGETTLPGPASGLLSCDSCKQLTCIAHGQMVLGAASASAPAESSGKQKESAAAASAPAESSSSTGSPWWTELGERHTFVFPVPRKRLRGAGGQAGSDDAVDRVIQVHVACPAQDALVRGRFEAWLSKDHVNQRSRLSELLAHEHCLEKHCRTCPHCGRVVWRIAGCSDMRCGRHTESASGQQDGCGASFCWTNAPRYSSHITLQVHPLASWLAQQQKPDAPRCVWCNARAVRRPQTVSCVQCKGPVCDGCLFGLRPKSVAEMHTEDHRLVFGSLAAQRH